MPAATRPAARRRSLPERTCVACRRRAPKRELIRVVHTLGGDVEVDLSGRLGGRGAYLCPRSSCWETVRDGRQLAGALRTNLTGADRERIGVFASTLTDNGNETAYDD